MELLCCSPDDDGVLRAAPDPHVLGDDRVLQRLLAIEDRYITSCAYFKCLQTDIQPHMRKIVATWMLEVCEEQHCQDSVFPLAMNYMDRFLSTTNILRSQLQLLGTVCLLVASKLRQCRPLSAATLVYYTDYSVTLENLTDWELLLLSRLKWDVSSVVPNDLVEYLLCRLPLKQDAVTVGRHATTFISLCATEYKFSSYAPSLVATASVAAAADGLGWLHKPWGSLRELLLLLQQITGIEADCIRHCVEQIEDLMSSNVPCFQQGGTKSGALPPGNSKIACSANSGSNTGHAQPETPTDVQDVHF